MKEPNGGTLRSALAIMLCVVPLVASRGADAQQRVSDLSYYDGHAGLLVRLLNGTFDRQGCARDDFYILPHGQAGYDEVVAMLISAGAAKQPVTIAVNGCSEGFPRISSVRLVF